MQIGDLVLYDRFGTPWQGVSPSFYRDDFGVGIVLDVVSDISGASDHVVIEVMKEDGKTACFSKPYIITSDIDFQRFQSNCVP